MFTFLQVMWNMKSGDGMCSTLVNIVEQHRKRLELGDGVCINAANQFGALQE